MPRTMNDRHHLGKKLKMRLGIRPYNRCPVCDCESLQQPCYSCHGKEEYKRGMMDLIKTWRYYTERTDMYSLGGLLTFEHCIEKLRKKGKIWWKCRV